MYCSTFTDTNQIKTISREILVDLARILTGLLTFSNPSKQRNIYISSTILPTRRFGQQHTRGHSIFLHFLKKIPRKCKEVKKYTIKLF